MSNLLQKYNEYANARSELIEYMRKLRNEISEHIDNNGLEDEINYKVFHGDHDPYPNEDEFDINILGGNVVFHFSRIDVWDDFEYSWTFEYQPQWEGLSVEEIVQDIVKQSKELYLLQRERSIKEIKRQAEELGISAGEVDK